MPPPSPASRLVEYVTCALALGRGPGAAGAIFWHATKNARVRLGLGTHRPDRVYAVSTVYGRFHFRDNFGDITNLVNLFHRRAYRITAVAGEGDIVDVGANIGLAAAWFAHHNPGRPIHCFEPLPASAALIPLNCPGARVEAIALGARPGRAVFRVDRDQVMASAIPCPWPTTDVELPVVPLDEVAARRGLGPVALLKIDAEGMEVDILDGAAAVLACTAQVIVETHGPERHRATVARLAGAGFAIDTVEASPATALVFASRRATAP